MANFLPPANGAVGLRSSYLKLHSKSNLDQVQKKVIDKKGLRLLSLFQLGEFTTDYYNGNIA